MHLLFFCICIAALVYLCCSAFVFVAGAKVADRHEQSSYVIDFVFSFALLLYLHLPFFCICTYYTFVFVLQCFCICGRSKSGGQTPAINQCSPCQLPIHAHIYNLSTKCELWIVKKTSSQAPRCASLQAYKLRSSQIAN